MPLEIAFLFGLLGVMVVLFLTEKLPVDVTAFAGLSLLVATGLVTTDDDGLITTFNPAAGATAIGARQFLIAYNVNLNTTSTRRANGCASASGRSPASWPRAPTARPLRRPTRSSRSAASS